MSDIYGQRSPLAYKLEGVEVLWTLFALCSVMLCSKIRTVNNLATTFDEYFQQLAQ